MADETVQDRQYSIGEALRAQGALRDAAGLAPEMFSVPAFVGMISDEIDALRERNVTDDEIAAMVRKSSDIRITAEDIAQFYASPAERGYGPPAE